MMIMLADNIGMNTITKNNVSGWLKRVAMMEGVYGHFTHNIVPIEGLYEAEEVIAELEEKYDDLPESVAALKETLSKIPKEIRLPKVLDPFIFMAHIGFQIDVPTKTWKEFCAYLSRVADNAIEESIDAIQARIAEKHKETNNGVTT
jgi:hypothetical protein